jgi:hypothetical protein
MRREGTKDAKEEKINNLSVLCPTGRLRSAFAVNDFHNKDITKEKQLSLYHRGNRKISQ